jgi:hypothetical protein
MEFSDKSNKNAPGGDIISNESPAAANINVNGASSPEDPSNKAEQPNANNEIPAASYNVADAEAGPARP